MDYYSKYLKQVKNIGNPQFDRYIRLYYDKDDDYVRTVLEDNSLQLKTKDGKTTIKLTFGKSINIYKKLNDLIIDKKKYIYNLNKILINSDITLSSENIKAFEEIKKNLITKQDEINNIQKILDDHDNIKSTLNQQLDSLSHELYVLFEKRNTYFSNIKDISAKDLLMFKGVFINEKNIDHKRIEILSKKFDINEKVIKCIFNWFLISKKYIKLQSKIDIDNIDSKNQITHIENILKDFFIIEPIVVISGDKSIKVRNPSFKDIKDENKIDKIEEEELDEEPVETLEEREESDESDEESEATDEELEEGQGPESVASDALEDLEESEGEEEIDPGDETNVEIEELDEKKEDKKGGDIKYVSISNESLKDLSQGEIKSINLL